MSLSASTSGSERIDSISLRRRPEMRFERFPIDHIDRFGEKSGDKVFNTNVVEHGDVRARIELDEDIDVAVGPVVSARHRAKKRGVGYPALAQRRFVLPQRG